MRNDEREKRFSLEEREDHCSLVLTEDSIVIVVTKQTLRMIVAQTRSLNKFVNHQNYNNIKIFTEAITMNDSIKMMT